MFFCAVEPKAGRHFTFATPDRSGFETLRREATAWNRRMNRDRVKITWKFDRKTARRKFRYKTKPFKRSET